MLRKSVLAVPNDRRKFNHEEIEQQRKLVVLPLGDGVSLIRA